MSEYTLNSTVARAAATARLENASSNRRRRNFTALITNRQNTRRPPAESPQARVRAPGAAAEPPRREPRRWPQRPPAEPERAGPRRATRKPSGSLPPIVSPPRARQSIRLRRPEL